MKKISYILLLLTSLAMSSCLKSNLEELPVYTLSDITSVSAVQYRYLSSEISPASNEAIVKNVTLNQTAVIDDAARNVNITATVPDNFPADQLPTLTESKLLVALGISPAARIAPVDGSPVLGIPSDWSKPNKYVVTAADGSSKEWTVKVTLNRYINGINSVLYKNASAADSDEGIALTQNSVVDAEQGIITIGVNVPNDFPANELASLTNSRLVVNPNLSVAARTVTPVDGAPAFGSIGDWSKPNKYMVTATDGSTKEWTVKLTFNRYIDNVSSVVYRYNPAGVDENIALDQTVAVDAEQGTIAISVGVPSDFPKDQLPSLTASRLVVTLSLSPAEVSITPLSGSAALDEPADWSRANKYTVTAADGSTKEWTISLTLTK